MSSSSPTLLQDRAAAGRRLVEPLLKYAHRPDVIVLALPRGGVPVAYEVAAALDSMNTHFGFTRLTRPRSMMSSHGKPGSCCVARRFTGERVRLCNSRIRW
jgi:orotate phosphoribosyltransferase